MPVGPATYQTVQQAILYYYYQSAYDAWSGMYDGLGGYTPEATSVLQDIPEVGLIKSNSGAVLSQSYAYQYPAVVNPAAVIDSNLDTGEYGVNTFRNSIPATVVEDAGETTVKSGSILASTGETVATVMDKLSLAKAGVSLGTKLGMAIDDAIYKLDPEWWDNHFPSINPETWDTMASTESGKQFVQGLFGLKSDGTSMYIDERLLAQTYLTMAENGAFTHKGAESTYDTAVANGLTRGYSPYPIESANVTTVKTRSSLTTQNGYCFRVGDNSAPLYTFALALEGRTYGNYNSTYYYLAISEAPFRAGSTWARLDTAMPALTENASSNFTRVSGKTFYYWMHGTASEGNYPDYVPNVFFSSNYNVQSANQVPRDLGTIIFDGVTEAVSALDGVKEDPRATTHIDPSRITGTTTPEVLQQLKTNYPELFDDAIYQDVPQPDGTTDRITYIPVPVPDTLIDEEPVTGERTQTDVVIDPETAPQSLLDELLKILTIPQAEVDITVPLDPSVPNTTTNPPETGVGVTPPLVAVEGSASSLWKIYNPSQSEIDAFGAWLWSSNFIDQIKKLFNDPMQAIIGVHKVFCNPHTSGASTIKCGYLDSGVSADVVSNQYTHIDCGTIKLSEYFGNVFDYDPYTRVSIFLPCIGIVPLDVADVMRSSISVKLRCDVLTGALLAEVSVKRDNAGGVLYTYSGSCIVTYPVSAGTYMGAVANVVSVAASAVGSIVGTAASGGAMLPAAIRATGNAVSGLAHTRTNVQHSGSFSGAAGVMGGKIPYLIISRPQTRMADNYEMYDGVPANYTCKLSKCHGYIKVKELHLKTPSAYDNETDEIAQLLHSGVLID